MPLTPEDQAREKIDELLTAAGWHVCDVKDTNIHAARGVAIREFPLPGHGFADYLLYVDGKAAGVIEAKREGVTLSGVEIQAEKYSKGLPAGLPRVSDPLPFAYQSTGTETRFTNGLDPQPRSRAVSAFHRAEHLAELLDAPASSESMGEQRLPYGRHATFLSRLQEMPELKTEGLWPAQIKAIQNLETSLKENRPRALIQMATGSGKTFTSISFIYRLIKFAGARRVLFLVDRGNLGDQTLKEFQQYDSPYNNFKFTEEYIVQKLQSNVIDQTARVCICTIQRMYSILKGKDLPDDMDDQSLEGLGSLFKQAEPIEYNPNVPIEAFDIIVTDECHRSIYNLWAQVLEYFDAYLIGLTATPSKQTFGFFNQNLVMEYNHEMAVADGVNVNYDVYRIRTAISEAGSKVEAGYSVQILERETRNKRWQELDEDFSYDPNQLDRSVTTPDQIRTIIRTFREKLFKEIYPGRTWVPKTLIFAKDDNHAENIVDIVRQEFGDKGSNEFCKKITYRTTGEKPKDLINEFRTSPMPRIAVTVDMIATGTDIKAVEIVMFMRAVKSRSFFEQMKGRGVRVIKSDDLLSITPDAGAKDHFVIVDAVGVCERDMTDSRPMEQKPTVSFEKLMQAVVFGNTDGDVLTSLAGRLARMEHRLSADDDRRIREVTDGLGVKEISHNIIAALDPDRHIDAARADLHIETGPVPDEAIAAARQKMIQEAIGPLHNPKTRETLDVIKKKNEIVIDTVSKDQVLESSFSATSVDRARAMVQSFEHFIEEHKDEITALQILYSMPHKERRQLGSSVPKAGRLTFSAVKELAEAIERPPYLWNESQLWNAYVALESSKVKGASGRRILTDLVSLVRFAMHEDAELIPFPDRVHANFEAWMTEQQKGGRSFTDEQRRWLTMIRDHIAANLSIEADDFEYAPFSQHGGLGRLHQLFGDGLDEILSELSEILAA